MVWIRSLSFCSQKLSLESVNAFGALWFARIQSPQLPRKRGERVCASHLFEYGKTPRPSSYPSKIVINPAPSSHFPHLILLHFSYFLWVHGTLMVKVTLKSSKKRPNDKGLIT